ncbi:MAG: asparagine synthase C-terminal domain-containing protein [bacterium]
MRVLMDEIRTRLKNAVDKSEADGLLFSGGLDSSILAALAPGVSAFTVTLAPHGEDGEYAKMASRSLPINWDHRMISIKEAVDSIPAVIGILKSFDPAMPNDITTYFGLKLAQEKGAKRVMTGDGSDELFAGYSFMFDLPDPESYIRGLKNKMCFSSNILGQKLGVKIKQPYLSREMIELALEIPKELKIKVEGEKRWGKWILRKAFGDVLPPNIIWQDKRPLEYGSGTRRLRRIISEKISDEEFEEKRRLYPVKFMSKEHLYCYEIYRKVAGEIPSPKAGQVACAGCGAGIEKEANHCRICGTIQNE